GRQFVALRRIHAAESDEFPVGKMKIKAWATQMLYTAAREHRSHVRLVGFPGIGEMLVAIDAKYRPVRRHHVIRRKARELPAETAGQIQHGDLDQFFVLLLAWLKPLRPVVTLEVAQESNGLRRKACERPHGSRASQELCHC